MKRLLIQGATGSIGQSTFDVIRAHRDQFEVIGIAARTLSNGLLDLAREFGVRSIAVAEECAERQMRESGPQNLQISSGPLAIAAQAQSEDYDLLVNALLGSAGLEPTAAALNRGISVALANKETLVAAGPLIMDMARRNGAAVLPIDSEHSAIYQCMLGESRATVRTLWLTTSGGPFWGRRMNDLHDASIEQALNHPTWKMGAKITVDSATLFNKGLEIIEAARLFSMDPNDIRVVAHRQSIVHSLIEFVDGSIKAQLSSPDMRLPILFALTYPHRVESSVSQTKIEYMPALTFEPVPAHEFPCLDLARAALRRGGTAPAALSAADEIAVEAFLNKRIRFTDIPAVLSQTLESWPDEPLDSIERVRTADLSARTLAEKTVETLAEAECC